MRKWDEDEDTMTLQYEVDFVMKRIIFYGYFNNSLHSLCINWYVILYKLILWQKQVYRPFCSFTFSLNTAFKTQKLIKSKASNPYKLLTTGSLKTKTLVKSLYNAHTMLK